jgi:hypothetical protein
MESPLDRARAMEGSKHYRAALDAYGAARRSDDAEERLQGIKGQLRLHEKDQSPDPVLKTLGLIVLVITLLGGLGLVISALPKGGGAISRGVPLNEARMILGISLTLVGTIGSALLIAVARIVRLLECMELRQALEREERSRV